MGPAANVHRARLGDRSRARPVAVAGPGGGDRGPGHGLEERHRVDGQHLVGLGLGPPPLDHRRQPIGVGHRPVVALGRVGDDVVELPAVVVRRGVAVHHRDVRDRLPALVVDRSAPEHLEVLGGAHLGRVVRCEGRADAHAVHRQLLDPVDRRRRDDACGLEQRREQVDGVDVLVADLALRRDAGGPVDDERVAGAALVDLALPTAVRGVAGDGPAPRVVVVDPRAADLVDALERLGDGSVGQVPRSHVVDRPGGATLARGPVVRQDHQQGVVEVAGSRQEVDDPADLLVGVGEHGGEALHVPGVQPLLVAPERVPGRHPVGAG